jgi:type IV pilus assembly protein PilF
VATVKQVASNTTEPTSTQPIPAKRDVPLPEALPKVSETKVVETEVVKAEVIAVAEVRNNIDMVEPEDVLHTVIPGENLYSISVEYNVKLNTLRKWNNISEKNKIQIGDKLYVVDPQTVKNIND